MAEGNDDWFKVAIALYTEQRTQLRHHELQRTAVTTFAMALTAGVATVGVNTHWVTHVLFITFLQMHLAGFALLMCEKLYERSRLHRRRSEALMKQMTMAAPLPPGVGDNFMDVWSSIDRNQQRDYGVLVKHRLHLVWLFIHVGSVLFGFVMSAIIAYKACGGRGLALLVAGSAPLVAMLVIYVRPSIRAKES